MALCRAAAQFLGSHAQGACLKFQGRLWSPRDLSSRFGGLAPATYVDQPGLLTSCPELLLFGVAGAMQCTLQAISWPSTSTLPMLYQTGTCRHPYLTRYIIRYDSNDYGAAVLSDQRPSLPAHGTRTQEEPIVLGENPGWRGRGVLMSSFAAAAPPIGRENWGPGSGDAAGFRHATLNVNGLNEGQLDKILIWMMKESIDSIILIDVRGSNAALPY